MSFADLQQQALSLSFPERWRLVNALLGSLQRDDRNLGEEDDTEYFHEDPDDRQRLRDEMFQEFPSMRDDPEADYWMDMAYELGCDPESLRANLD